MICCFVVLHYKNLEVTEMCINSILNLYGIVPVIVVDNASCDKSSYKLINDYSSRKNVEILILKETKGFSYGNNYGCEYVIAKYNPDYLIVCNSDTQFIDADFLDRIDTIYSETQFAVLGPDIIRESACEHQSPFRISYMSVAETCKEIRYYRKRYLVCKMINRLSIGNLIAKIKSIRLIDLVNRKIEINRIKKQHRQMKCNIRQRNVCLYGACLIFSKQYTSLYKKIFDPETSFYCEEDIILAKCLSKNLLVLYDPSIRVYHLGKASTYLNSDFYSDELLRLELLISSRYRYIDYLNQLGPIDT